MKYNSNYHKRKSIRLKGYDYSKAGMYFATICTQNRECLFGEIENGEMILNDAGLMVKKCWNDMYKHFNNVIIDNYIIMPNHFHVLIEIIDVGVESISTRGIGDNSNRADMESAPTQQNGNILKIVQSFKRYTTIEYIKMVKQNIMPPFNKRIWQRNYYENIIRNEKIYPKISEYIKTNPLKWEEDKYFK